MINYIPIFKVNPQNENKNNQILKRKYLFALFLRLVLIPTLISLFFLEFLHLYRYEFAPELSHSIPEQEDIVSVILYLLLFLSAIITVIGIIFLTIKMVTLPKFKKVKTKSMSVMKKPTLPTEDLRKYGTDFIRYVRELIPNAKADDVIFELDKDKGIEFTIQEADSLYRYIRQTMGENELVINDLSRRKPTHLNFTKKQKMKIKNKVFYFLGFVFLFLLFTNPSARRYKEYLGRNSYTGLKRKSNYLLFSIYSTGSVDYVGAVFNFFEIKSKKQ